MGIVMMTWGLLQFYSSLRDIIIYLLYPKTSKVNFQVDICEGICVIINTPAFTEILVFYQVMVRYRKTISMVELTLLIQFITTMLLILLIKYDKLY